MSERFTKYFEIPARQADTGEVGMLRSGSKKKDLPFGLSWRSTASILLPHRASLTGWTCYRGASVGAVSS